MQKKNEKKHFKELGRKGGLKKKTSNQFSKVISSRFTEKEYQELENQAQELNVKLSALLRLIVTEKELKINEFKTDEILFSYGTHFIRIRNLLRNKEWNEFENKKQILSEIEHVLKLIRDYVYQKSKKSE